MSETTADPFTTGREGGRANGSQPLLHQHGGEVQRFGEMRLLPIALAYEARAESGQLLKPHPGRLDHPVRPVQEAPLAGARAHLLPI